MPEKLIPSILHANEDTKLRLAVAEELEVKDPENDDEANKTILENTAWDVGSGTCGDNRQCGENHD